MQLKHRIFPAVGLVLLFASAPASAGMNKCTAPDGKVTFTERACDVDQQQTGLRSWGGAAPTVPSAPAAATPAAQAAAAPAGLPYLRNTPRCRSLQKSLDEAEARSRNALTESRAMHASIWQQRTYYEEAYRKECIDEQAKAEFERKRASQECVDTRKRIEEAKHLITLNANRPVAAARLREDVIRTERSLAEKCPS